MEGSLLSLGFPGGADGKESVCHAGDLDSIPGLGRSPEGRKRLPMPVFWPGEFYRVVWQVTVLVVMRSQTRLSDFHRQ